MRASLLRPKREAHHELEYLYKGRIKTHNKVSVEKQRRVNKEAIMIKEIADKPYQTLIELLSAGKPATKKQETELLREVATAIKLTDIFMGENLQVKTPLPRKGRSSVVGSNNAHNIKEPAKNLIMYVRYLQDTGLLPSHFLNNAIQEAAKL